jgi:antitoxin PrlF
MSQTNTKPTPETLEQAVKRAQEIVRRYIPEGQSLSNELIEERRQENLAE